MIREFIATHRLFAVTFVLMVVGGLGMAMWLPRIIGTAWLVIGCLAYGFIYGLYLGVALSDLAHIADERKR